MDCPLCGERVGFAQGKIGPAPASVSVVRRDADQAAAWAASQASSAGGTLQGYLSSTGAGIQYANYWAPQEIKRADAMQQAQQRSP
jgi:hypothetical protein